MARQLRWVLIALGVLALARGGASIFSHPDNEILYGTSVLPPACVSSGCIFIYTLTVGNTGTHEADHVRVHLRENVLATALLRPTVRTFGKVERPVAVSEADGIRTYGLGRLKPGERVEVSFTVQRPDRTGAPAWESTLVGVDAAHGVVRAGDPAAVSLGRLLYTFFGVRW